MGKKHLPELRGGSWNNNDNNCRVANRNNNPDNRNNNNGFRVANALNQAGTGKKPFYRERVQTAQFFALVRKVSNYYLQVSRAILPRAPDLWKMKS